MRVGDAANGFIIANSVSFLAFVIAHDQGLLDLFSPAFLKEGFCVGNKETPYLQSHILAFYVDLVAATALWLLNRRVSGMQGFAPLKSAPSAILIHGLAHLGIWSHPMDGPNPMPPPEGAKLAVTIAFLWAFFFLLLRSAPKVPPAHAAFHAALHAPILQLLVPPQFGFTYVQTVLLLVVACYDLLTPKGKDKFYDLNALVIGCPIGIVGWCEALGCEFGYRRLGGHALYDATIPASMFAYLAIALAVQPPLGQGKELKTQ